MPKSKFEKIYEEKTGLKSINNDCVYTSKYVGWLEYQLEKRIIEFEATERAMEEHNTSLADILVKF